MDKGTKLLERLVAFGISGLFVFWMWNVIMVPKFGFPPFNYWESLGILVLCRQLFIKPTLTDGQDNGE